MPKGSKPGSEHWQLRLRDTDLYCQFRACHLANDKLNMERALSSISTEHARRCAKSIVRTGAYADALDPLLAIEGLRAGFWLKMMHRIIGLGFDEVK
jgi:hypothetical protein